MEQWYVRAVGHDGETEHSNGYDAYESAIHLVECGLQPHIERVSFCNIVTLYTWQRISEEYGPGLGAAL